MHTNGEIDQELNLGEIAYAPTTGVSKVFEIPLVQATEENVKSYGQIVNSAEECTVEIVRWPAQGWRPVDTNSGDQGGTVEGLFELWWRGDTLWGRNNAVGSSYHFAWSRDPSEAASTGNANLRDKALIWRANYHPDSGQMFFPEQGQSFIVPLALPGDDVTPDKFTAFQCGGGKGLYIHPNIW